MKKLAVSIVLLILAMGGGGYLYASERAEDTLEAVLMDIRATLPEGAILAYQTAEAEPASRGARLTGVTIVQNDERTRIAEVTVKGAEKGRAEEIRFSGIDIFAKDGSVAVDEVVLARTAFGTEVTPAGSRLSVAPDTLSFDTVTLNGLKFTDGKVGFGLAEIAVRDYGAGRLSSLSATGLEFVDSDKSGAIDGAKLGRMEFRGLDLAGLITAAKDGRELPRLEQVDRMSLSDFTLNKEGKALFRIAAIMGELTKSGATGHMSSSRIDGIEMHPSVLAEIPSFASTMTDLGYERLVGEMKLLMNYDSEARSAEIGMEIGVVDAGGLTLGISLRSAPNIFAAQESPPEAWLETEVAALKVAYSDKSLTERMVRSFAKDTGTTPQEVVAGFVQDIEAQLAAGAAQSPTEAELMKAAVAHARKPGTIAILARAKEPLPLPDLLMGLQMAPQILLESFEVTVSQK